MLTSMSAFRLTFTAVDRYGQHSALINITRYKLGAVEICNISALGLPGVASTIIVYNVQ